MKMVDLFDSVHEDDMKKVGMAANAIPLLEIDWAKHRERQDRNIRLNIAVRKMREANAKEAAEKAAQDTQASWSEFIKAGTGAEAQQPIAV